MSRQAVSPLLSLCLVVAAAPALPAQIGGTCGVSPPVQSYIVRTLPPGYQSIAGQPGTLQAFPSCTFATNFSVGLPFPITFFGQAKTTLQIHRNGFVHFIAGAPFAGANVGIPNPAVPNDYAAPFWENLQPAPGTGEVLYRVAGQVGQRIFTAEWKDAMGYGGTGCVDNGARINFQVKIFEGDGSIEFHYGPFTPPGTGALSGTIGLENATGTLGVVIGSSAGTNATFPSTNLRFYPGAVSEVVSTYTITALPPAFSSIAGVPGATQVFFPPTPALCYDDQGVSLAIPFPFSFWNEPKTSVQMSMNGIATFDFSLGVGGAGNPNALPAMPGAPQTAIPNDYAAPWWDDLTADGSTSPNAGGWWLVTGAPGNQALILEWNELDRFQTATCTDTGDRLTFQVQLHEAGNVVFSYGTQLVGTTGTVTATVGLENTDGTDGLDVTGQGATNATFPLNDYLLTPCDPTGVFLPFGNGCSGGLPAAPSIGSAGGNPVAGNLGFSVTLSGGPPSSPANTFLLGASGSQWLVFPLPLGLGLFGFPGCSLFASADVLVSGVPTTAGGGASLSTPIPNLPALVGASIWVQWFSITATPALAVSNGAQIVIG